MNNSKKIDIYTETGRREAEKIRKYLERDLQNPEELGMEKIIDSSIGRIAKSIAQGLRAKAMHRRRKADKHAETKDLFDE